MKRKTLTSIVLLVWLIPLLLIHCSTGQGEMADEGGTVDDVPDEASSDSSNGGGDPQAILAKVVFEYFAPTATDPAVAQQYPDCVQGVGQTHIHPSWKNFIRIDMIPVGGDLWTISFEDVPADALQRIRISDGNACAADNSTGASTLGVFANDVELTQVVDTPGTGVEPGLAFSVNGAGIVNPD